MRYHTFNIGGPHTDAWWARNVEMGIVTAGYDGVVGDRGDVILNDMDAGDWVIAYSNRHGFVGAGRIEDANTYRLLTADQLPQGYESNHLHVRDVAWEYVITSMTDAVSKEQADTHAPRQTKELMDETKGTALIGLIAAKSALANTSPSIAQAVSMDEFVAGPQYVEGNIYSRREHIHLPFGGSTQSGISPSAKWPAIFIFTGDEGHAFGYSDHWDEANQVFTYTGEGQVGPMAFSKGNKAIRDHVKDGRALHMFLKTSRAGGLYQYIGEMQCAGTQVIQGPDRNGSVRDIIQFQLVRLRAITDAEAELEQPKATTPAALDALRKKAYDAVTPPEGSTKSAVRSIYARSKEVATYVLSRANGLCEGCAAAAPFLRSNGTPYLEVHHIDRVSDGGLDSPDRVAALCPTCHRCAHYSIDAKSWNQTLRLHVLAVEAGLESSGWPHVTT